MPAKTSQQSNSADIAVIDIGSNSVRLAIYRHAGKKHRVIYQKKAVCGLARGLSTANPKLNRDGMQLTLKALRKFRSLLASHAPQTVSAIGTAAMRTVAHTRDGKKFHRQAEVALGHKIKIISGRKEARLTAYGVMSGLSQVTGICGDFGGGSLELASINHGKVGHTVTMPLGSLTLITESGGDAVKAKALMYSRLDRVKWLGRYSGRNFYPIGGSWRAVARVMMRMQGKAIRSVHGFSINGKIAEKYAKLIAGKKPAAFRRMHKKIRRRADVIPFAAAALAEIIARTHPARIIFSAHGVREGVVKEQRN